MKKIILGIVILSSAASGFSQQRVTTAVKDSALCKKDSVCDRALPSPLPNLPFPSADWCGPVIGESQDAPDYPLQKDLGLANDASRIKIYGWFNPSYNYNTSKTTTIPISYDIIPNSFQLDQAVLRIERQPNTVQTDYVDWGFRVSGMYGIDYRYTTAEGWFSNQYFKQNNLYGFDNTETYFLLYIPMVAQGMMIQIGRYISPPDIEAQLSPENYLFTHSVMFSYDPYTMTGANASVRVSEYVTFLVGVNAGSDNAPWSPTASLNGQALLRWVAKNNNNSIWGGVNEIGPNEHYRTDTIWQDNQKEVIGKDQLQQAVATWGHRFSKRVHMMTEAYYMWSLNAAMGGTASAGPVQYDAGGGPGTITPGISDCVGAVNYFQILLGNNNKTYLSIRNDMLDDPQGWRTGYPTTYISHTIGYIHFFTDIFCIRPEIRYDYNVGNSTEVHPYDEGTRNNQFSIAMDMIARF